MRKTKYNARRVQGPDSDWFDSQMELEYLLDELKPMLADGSITDLHRQTIVRLIKTKGAMISMIPDYDFMKDGVRVYLDVKGMETPVFKLKARLWKTFGPGPLMIIKRVKKKFVTDRIITPIRGREEAL